MVQAGLEDKGQKVSKQDIRVEQKVSVALLASRYDNCLRGGSEDKTIADSREGESKRKLRRKVTCGGVCDVSGYENGSQIVHIHSSLMINIDANLALD